MATLNEAPTYEVGIYQLEESDLVIGGADGVDNLPHRQLANRTAALRQRLDGTQPLVLLHANATLR